MNAPDMNSLTIPALAMEKSELVKVLQASLYPGATEASVALVLGYCQASQLDPMLKPVHIVPMKVATGKLDDRGYAIKEPRDVLMPGIGLYRTNAERTGRYAGKARPEFGPMQTMEYHEEIWFDRPNGGRGKREEKRTFEYPEWCEVTVYKIVDGQKCAFTALEYWIENFASKFDGEPNEMWRKRARGQIAKCAEAQALRQAFPGSVGAQPTAEEMEGKSLAFDGETIDLPPPVDQPRSKSQPVEHSEVDFTEHHVLPPDGEQTMDGGDIEPPVDYDPPVSEAAPRPAVAAKPVSPGMIKPIERKMTNSGKTLKNLKAAFGIDDLSQMTTANYNEINAWASS